MWDAGKMPMKTCCSSSARAEGLAFEVDGSEDNDQLTCGRREVQTTYLQRIRKYGSVMSWLQSERQGPSYNLGQMRDGQRPREIMEHRPWQGVETKDALAWRAEQVQPSTKIECSPAVPNSLDLLVPRGVLLKRVYVVSNFE